MPKKQIRLSYLAILVLSFILYGSTLGNNYSLDDDYVINGNPLIEKGTRGIGKIFASPYVQKDNQTHSYRPVTLTSFAIEYQLFKAKPKMSHLINILLYALTCMILFKLLLRLFKGYHWILAALTVFIFLIHPVHSEVVNNVKSRDELLCFLFAILSLARFVKYVDTKKILSLIMGAVFLWLSLLSKPTSMTFLAIIPFTLWFFTDVKLKNLVLVMGGVVVSLLLVKFGASSVLSAQDVSRTPMFFENPLYTSDKGVVEKIPMAFFTVGYYLKMLFFPKTLICYYGYNYVPIAGWGNPLVWISTLLLPIGLFALYKIKTKAIWIYGTLYFFITISMFANLFKPAVGIIAERFVYLPSLGFCIVIAYILVKIFKTKLDREGKLEMNWRPVFFGCLAVLFIVSAGRIIVRNRDWKDTLTLLRHDVEYGGKSAKLNSMVATELFLMVRKETRPEVREKLTDESLHYFEQSLDVYPDYFTSWNNMATLYFNEKKEYDKAAEYYQKTLELDPENVASLFGVAYCYELEKKNDKAIEYFEKVLELEPNYIRATQHIAAIRKSME